MRAVAEERDKLDKQLRELETLVPGNGEAREPGKTRPYRVRSIERTTSYDDEGKGERTLTWDGITTEQTYENLRIPLGSISECPGATLGDPVLTERSEAPPRISLEDHEPVSLPGHEVLHEPFVVVAGRFAPDTDPIGFKMAQEYENLFCLTREEAEAAYENDPIQDEYFALPIRTHVDSMRLEVDFPESHRHIKPTPLVLIRRSETLFEPETRKLRERDAVEFVNGVATLEVDTPSQGLSYAISWTPPRGEKNDEGANPA